MQKSEELHPDLIVLDLGLPKLNGIEVARQIRKCSPASKILIVSQESSVDIAHEAFDTGVLGYVVKSYAGAELLPAVDSVLRGSHFVSTGLLPFLRRQEVGECLSTRRDLRLLHRDEQEIARTHEVQFYADDESLVVGWSRFIETALLAGNAVIVAATEIHQRALFHRLQEGGVNLPAAIEQGRYLTLDIAKLSRPSW